MSRALALLDGQTLTDLYLADAVAVLAAVHGVEIADKKARGERPKLLSHLSSDGTRPAGKQLKLFS